MRISAILIGIISLLFLFTPHVFAANVSTNTSTQSATSSATTNELDQSTSAGKTIDSIKNFVVSLDSMVGGFVFATPETLFNDSVQLKDGTSINNLSIFRNIFIALGIPITALLIVFVGGGKMMEGNIAYIKPFLGRIILYGVLTLSLPLFLTYSIKVENALTSSLLSAPVLAKQETSLSQFLTDYFQNASAEVSSGKATYESVGIPNVGFSGFTQSILSTFTSLALFIISIAALVFGILFILTQFALRFLTMLFLSLIFPLALPFVITDKTQGIFYSYLRIWFTFLIHQPSFALGYMLVMMIVRSILVHSGASLGLLFLYIASLFFLGTVNVLVARIFADAWIALGANLEAGIMANGISTVGGKMGKFVWRRRDAIVGGAKALGNSVKDNFGGNPTKRVPNFSFATSAVNADYGTPMLNTGIRAGVDTIYGNAPIGYSQPTVTQQQSSSPQPRMKPDSFSSNSPSYAREFGKKGFFVKQTDNANGVHSVSGTGYSYYDSKNNLSHTFPTKRDGIDSGYREDQLRQVSLSKRNIVDPTQFSKGNPHNTTATKRALELGQKSNFAHVTKRSDPMRIKNNLEMNDVYFKQLNVHGYFTRHFDNPNGVKSSKRATTRIVTLGKEEEAK